MPTLGVNIAIIDQGRILLTQREDYEVWCLPGGGVDANESLAQAAIREAREETGLEVELTRLVGVYSRPAWLEGGLHIVSFAARPVGGTLNPQPGEVLALAFFGPDALPGALLFGHRQRIMDALNGVTGVAWAQNAEWPFGPETARRDLYAMRDQSGLTKVEFYQQYLARPVVGGDRLEVGKLPHER